jgi:hypothetical protein
VIWYLQGTPVERSRVGAASELDHLANRLEHGLFIELRQGLALGAVVQPAFDEMADAVRGMTRDCVVATSATESRRLLAEVSRLMIASIEHSWGSWPRQPVEERSSTDPIGCAWAAA